jgi:type II secretory pathway component PulM
MPLQPSEKKQLTFAGVLFALAILFFVLFGPTERVALEYFYDES